VGNCAIVKNKSGVIQPPVALVIIFVPLPCIVITAK